MSSSVYYCSAQHKERRSSTSARFFVPSDKRFDIPVQYTQVRNEPSWRCHISAMLSELCDYLCQLKCDWKFCRLPHCSQPKIMQIMNREKTLNPFSPTQFLQTQDVPLGKHRQQNTSCKGRFAAERRECKQLANSQKSSCCTLEIKCWGWGLNKGVSRGCSLEVFLLQTPVDVIWPMATVQGNLWGPSSPTELLM